MSTATAIERTGCAHAASDDVSHGGSAGPLIRPAAGVTGFDAACRTVYQRAPP